MSSDMGSVALIMKVTRSCNLRWLYCLDWRAAPEVMSFEVLAKTVASALRAYDRVQFIWHGGETTVVPIAFYKKAMALQARFLRPGCTVRNDIQTNGTRLSDEWMAFFKDAAFGVGISLDGPKVLHDRNRRFANGRGSYDDVQRGIELLRKHSLPVSVLMVVDEDALAFGPDGIFDFFLERGISSYGCLPAKPRIQPGAPPGTVADHYIEPTRMTKFFARLYDRWLEHGAEDIRIRELAGIHDRLMTGKSAGCVMDGNCFGQYFIVEPTGEIAHCDLFLGDENYGFGNVLSTSFTEILKGSRMEELKRRNALDLEQMRGHCNEFSMCMGGCPHDRYISYRHNPQHSERCCGKRELIAHIRNRIGEKLSRAPRPCESAMGGSAA